MPNVPLQISSLSASHHVRVRCRVPASRCGSPVPTSKGMRGQAVRASPGDQSSSSGHLSSKQVSSEQVGADIPVSDGASEPEPDVSPKVQATSPDQPSDQAVTTPGANSDRNSGVQLAQRPHFDNEALLDNWEEFVQARREAERDGLSDQDELWSNLKDALDDASDDEDEFEDSETDDFEEEATTPAPAPPVEARPGFTSPLEVRPPSVRLPMQAQTNTCV